MDKIRATITVTFLGLGPQRFFEEQISYSLSGLLEGSDSILATCMQASLSLFLWLAWLFLGNIELLITADLWRGMGSGELDPSLPWVGEVRTESVLPVRSENITKVTWVQKYLSFGPMPGQFRLRIFKVNLKSLTSWFMLKIWSKQCQVKLNICSAFRFWSDRNTAKKKKLKCVTHLLHDTLVSKSK